MPNRLFAPLALAATFALPLAALPLAAQAGGLKAPQDNLHLARGTMKSPSVMPPAGYQGQWWTHPAGCEYSRAGRPGEVVWFLSSIPKGATCPEFIHQKKIDQGYSRGPFMIKG